MLDETSFILLLAIAAGIVVAQSFLSVAIKGRVRTLSPELAEKLAVSHPILGIPVSGWYRFVIWRRGYLALDDRALTRMGDLARILFFVFVAIFVIYAALILHDQVPHS